MHPNLSVKIVRSEGIKLLIRALMALNLSKEHIAVVFASEIKKYFRGTRTLADKLRAIRFRPCDWRRAFDGEKTISTPVCAEPDELDLLLHMFPCALSLHRTSSRA